MGSKINERLSVAVHAVTEDLGAESTVADSIVSDAYVKLDKYQKFIAVASAQGAAATDVHTLTLYQATAAAGTGSKTLTTTVTDTATSTHLTDLLMCTAECDATELDTNSSFYWVGARLTTDNGSGTEAASIVGIRVDGRYDPQSN